MAIWKWGRIRGLESTFSLSLNTYFGGGWIEITDRDVKETPSHPWMLPREPRLGKHCKASQCCMKHEMLLLRVWEESQGHLPFCCVDFLHFLTFFSFWLSFLSPCRLSEYEYLYFFPPVVTRKSASFQTSWIVKECPLQPCTSHLLGRSLAFIIYSIGSCRGSGEHATNHIIK